MEQRRFLKLWEAADRLSVTERFLEKKIAEGKLAAYRVADSKRIVRVLAEDVDALVRPK